MKEEDKRFYEEKVNTLKEHYEALVDVTRKYLYPWDFKPLGWCPETKDWSIKKTVLFGFFMPYMAFDPSYDSGKEKKLAGFKLGIIFAWVVYCFIATVASVVFVVLIQQAFVKSTEPSSNSSASGVFFWVVILVFALIPYIQTLWYIFNKKTDWLHRGFIVLADILFGYLLFNYVSKSANPFSIIFEYKAALPWVIFIVWTPLLLTTTILLLISIKLFSQGVLSIWLSLMRAYSTSHAKFIDDLIFGNEKTLTTAPKLIDLDSSEITFIKELAQRNLDSAEKRTTPTIILLTLLGVIFAFSPLTDLLNNSFESTVVYFKTIPQAISQIKGFMGAFLSQLIFFAALTPLALLLTVLGQYIQLIRSIFTQGILIEGCTIAEYAKLELEKSIAMQNQPRSPWQSILEWFFGKQRIE